MTIAVLFALLGLMIRYLGEKMEQKQVQLISNYFTFHESNDTTDLEPDELTAVLERTSNVLSSTKVLRLFSLLFLVPSFMIVLYYTFYSSDHGNPAWLWQISAVVFLFVVLTSFSFITLNKKVAVEEAEHDLPNWMTDREENLPFVYTVCSQIWEKLLFVKSPLLKLLDIQPQPAYLFESNGMFHLDMQTPVELEDKDDDKNEPVKKISLMDRTEEDMIQAIHRLDQTFAREIMKPINQVTAVRLSDHTPDSFLELARVTGFTRIPCYKDKVTELIGYINIYDILEQNEIPESLSEHITKPLYFPEVARVDNVLSEMIISKKQVAIIYDEFGATSGWLSREDIFEEIVGEVEDEYEDPQNFVEEIEDGYIVKPQIDLDDLYDVLDLELSKDQCDTLAGYIYYRLGRTPRRGEEIVEQGWTIRVAGLENYRIRRVRLIPPREDS